TVLFLVGPLSNLGSTMQVFTSLNVAAERLFALQELLTRAAGRPATSPHTPPGLARTFSDGFREIRLDRVVFQHRPAAGAEFSLGPISLTIRAGELLFISGGNGAGKSTLIKILAGLYKPLRGTLRVDGTALADEEYQAYRDRIAVLFSDYHLFARL